MVSYDPLALIEQRHLQPGPQPERRRRRRALVGRRERLHRLRQAEHRRRARRRQADRQPRLPDGQHRPELRRLRRQRQRGEPGGHAGHRRRQLHRVAAQHEPVVAPAGRPRHPGQRLAADGAHAHGRNARVDQLQLQRDPRGLDRSQLSPWGGSGGNPRLRPYIANAFDITYEKYFGNKAYFAIGAFYKDLQSYVLTAARQPYDFTGFPVPGGGDPFLRTGFVTLPQNLSGGHIAGIETAVAVPGDMIADFLDGFGAQAQLFLHRQRDHAVPDASGDHRAGPVRERGQLHPLLREARLLGADQHPLPLRRSWARSPASAARGPSAWPAARPSSTPRSATSSRAGAAGPVDPAAGQQPDRRALHHLRGARRPAADHRPPAVRPPVPARLHLQDVIVWGGGRRSSRRPPSARLSAEGPRSC